MTGPIDRANDPEQSRGVTDRVDGRHYGDRRDEDAEPWEFVGIAPPCQECGKREVEDPETELCGECSDDHPERGGGA